MPITEVPLSYDHNEPNDGAQGALGDHNSGHMHQIKWVWLWVWMDLKRGSTDIYSCVKAIGVRDAVVGWCRVMMKWPKSEAPLLFSPCPCPTCCSQNWWAQVGRQAPDKITTSPLCLVCSASSKGGGFLGWKIREKLEEGGSEKLTASRIGKPSFSYSHHWEFVIMYVCFGFFKGECKQLSLLVALF